MRMKEVKGKKLSKGRKQGKRSKGKEKEETQVE